MKLTPVHVRLDDDKAYLINACQVLREEVGDKPWYYCHGHPSWREEDNRRVWFLEPPTSSDANDNGFVYAADDREQILRLAGLDPAAASVEPAAPPHSLSDLCDLLNHLRDKVGHTKAKQTKLSFLAQFDEGDFKECSLMDVRFANNQSPLPGESLIYIEAPVPAVVLVVDCKP
jgi:hypothetical protein